MALSFVRRTTARAGELIRARLDWIGGLLAFLYGLPTLGYAFGRDQAIFCYVGREWTAGRLPYAEAFDIKPPGIYAVYALAGELFGFRMWAVRLLELAAVLALGACVTLAIRRDQQRARGELGAMMLLTASFYYTVFDYWDTAQVEFWEGLFALLGYLAAERVRQPLRAAVAAGLLGGTAVMFKTPIVVVLPVAGCVVVARAYLESEGEPMRRARAAALAFVAHCVAGVGVAALVLGYFALRGGWPALVELSGYTATYVKNTQASAEDARKAISWFWGEIGRVWAEMLVATFAMGVLLAARRRARRVLGGQLLAVVLTLCAVVSVAVQLKFWSYHWVVAAPFALLCAAYGVSELARLDGALLVPLALMATLAGWFGTPRWGTNENVNYRSYTHAFWTYIRGGMRRAPFLEQFVGPYNYNYLVQEQVGDAIGELAQPGDQMHVRGFEPSIYITARLASPSRFASEAPISAPTLTFNRDTWVAEHKRALRRKPPQFFVTFLGTPDDIEEIKAQGYHPLGQLGPFFWLERDAPREPAPEAAPTEEPPP